MSLRFLNSLLLACLPIVIAFLWSGLWDPTRPNFDFLPEMARSVPYDSFSANANFSDGKTLQRPVPGTIPRGLLPLHYQATRQDAQRAGDELHNPYSAQDEESLQRGAFVYANFCRHCHGSAGRGDGPIALRGYPPPPSLQTDQAVNMKDGEMFHVITYGRGNMPSHAAQISREDRWKVILHIRTLQKP